MTVAWNGSSWNSPSSCSWSCNWGYHSEWSSCVVNCTTTAKSASSSAIAYSSRGNCSYGYEDPDTCWYDNSCDCNGNRTWDGVICSCPTNYASSSAVAYSNKSSCSYGYEDPDICGYDNDCDCNGSRTWDGVICNSAPSDPDACIPGTEYKYRRCMLYNPSWCRSNCGGEKRYQCDTYGWWYDWSVSAWWSCSCPSNTTCSW